jgi:hypothetical protein
VVVSDGAPPRIGTSRRVAHLGAEVVAVQLGQL